MALSADFYVQVEHLLHDFFQSRRPAIMAAYGNVHADLKDDNTPVTKLDKALEAELRPLLERFDGGIGIEGEEHGVSGSRRTYWLVDPIDGTESFVRGLPFVRHMVTLIDDGQPVFTYVYKPVTQELFTAISGHGAYKNGGRLHASTRPINRCWIELSAPLQKDEVLPVVQAVRRRVNGYRTIGDFTLAAEGKIDAHLVYKSSGGPWDYAPRGLLLREAGYQVGNIGASGYDFTNSDLLAASPPVYDE